jgi:hypothetical protein
MHMSNWIAVAVVTCATIGGQGTDGRARSGVLIAAALSLMDAAYPDLVVGTLRIEATQHLDGFVAPFGVRLGKDPLPDEDVDASQCYGVFMMHPTGLNTYLGTGQCIRRPDNQSLRKEMEQHAEWTTVQIARLIEQRGGRYGPDREQQIIDRLIPFDVLEAITGEPLELTQVRFEMPQPSGNDKLGPYALHWRASYVAKNNRGIRFDAYYEPFDGALRAMSRRPPVEYLTPADLEHESTVPISAYR